MSINDKPDTNTQPAQVPEEAVEEEASAAAVAENEADTASVENAAEDETAEDASAEDDSPDDYEYVLPRDRRRKKRRKKNASKKKSSFDKEMDDFIFTPARKRHKHHKHHSHHGHHSHHSHHGHHGHHRHHKKRMPLWLRILIIVVAVILAIVIAIASAYYIMRSIGKNAMHNYDNIDISVPIQDDSGKDAVSVLNKGLSIKYNGKNYFLNENMMSIVFIGYNKEEGTDHYMADAIYIVATDAQTGKTSIIGVSRDTMLDVDIFSAGGEFIESKKTQLSYAYSYSSKKITGGKNVTTSLSRLFFGLPFENYFAIDLDALSAINDAVGGVTLTSKLTFDSATYGRTVKEGEEITLKGYDAVRYVQTRDHENVDANNARMDRQQQYIKAFLSSIVPAAKKDISTVNSLFGVVGDNSDTTLDLPKVTYIASTALSGLGSASEIEYYRLNGKMKMGENAEMYLDDTDVLETMLKVYYTPVD